MAGNAFTVLRKSVWLPGDAPETHPLYQEQVDLEVEMTSLGRAAFQAQEAKAREKRQLTRLTPYRRLIDRWLPAMVQGIKDFRRDSDSHYKATRGRPPLSVQLLKQVDAWQAALITLRHVLDSADLSGSVLTIAGSIGRGIEDEARMQAWEDAEPGLFQTVQKGLKAQGATLVHRRRVNINRFNKLVRDAVKWEDWDQGSVQQLGLSLIDILVRYTDGFRLDSDELGDKIGAKGLRKTPVRLRLEPETAEMLAKSLEVQEVLTPQYMPTFMPPRRWTSVKVGGYYTDWVRKPRVIRFKTIDPKQRQEVEEEYNALDTPKVYDALHTLQEVGWKINQRVWDVMRFCWENDLGTAGIPVWRPENQKRLPMPKKLPGGQRKDSITPPVDPNDAEAWRGWLKTDAGKRWRKSPEGAAWRRKAAPVWNERFLALADIKSFRAMMRVAERMGDHTFYFPHMLDFRGRMYPIPLYLQPQGADPARGLLTFAAGKEITAENNGLVWLCIHLANCYGVDKVNYEARIEWVNAQVDRWRAIAEDPIGTRDDWGKADSPWQALAGGLRVGRLPEPRLRLRVGAAGARGRDVQRHPAPQRDDAGRGGWRCGEPRAGTRAA